MDYSKALLWVYLPQPARHIVLGKFVKFAELLTLSDPGYFRQLTIRGGAFKAPPLRSRKLLCQSLPYHTCEFYQVFLA